MVNAKTTDISAAVSEATDGLGAVCSIDAVGAAETVETAIWSVRRDGVVVLVGNVSPSVSVPLQYFERLYKGAPDTLKVIINS